MRHQYARVPMLFLVAAVLVVLSAASDAAPSADVPRLLRAAVDHADAVFDLLLDDDHPTDTWFRYDGLRRPQHITTAHIFGPTIDVGSGGRRDYP